MVVVSKEEIREGSLVLEGKVFNLEDIDGLVFGKVIFGVGRSNFIIV